MQYTTLNTTFWYLFSIYLNIYVNLSNEVKLTAFRIPKNMTTIEPTIFHKYLHEVFIFAQITQAKRKEIMEKRPNQNENVRER